MHSALQQLLFTYTTCELCACSAFHMMKTVFKCHLLVCVPRKLFLCKVVELYYKINVFLACSKQSQNPWKLVFCEDKGKIVS